MANKLLEVDNLESWYESDKNILNGCSFDIEENEIVALVGSNGSGKTTLIKTITDIHPKFDAGRINFRGKNIDFSNEDFKLNRIAVFSEDNSFKYWTFPEYNEFLHKVYNREIDQEYQNHMIENFNFSQYINKPVKELSMGNKKKFFIIAAMGLKLPLVILDEPVDGLDFEGSVFLYKIMREYKKYGSIFMASHILESITESCDTYVLLDHGKLSEKNKVDGSLTSEKILQSFKG
ncbi:ATP-binding cassette domain-containing protein [uncultured Anaerococcus sp.]|uniref:ATP-binding cassette domain-containing protein n=1 Tax=uncultured Anaerococcus sp. TaxID=293428 RepID=UPI0025CCD8C9|nr:ABC transporter ATP-binding protein [uncultured Anaerococcus sp.]